MIVFGGRSIPFRRTRRVQRGFVIAALVALSLNWASKLIWLGM